MNFFKRIFGFKKTEQEKKVGGGESHDSIPWMTDLRRETLSICLDAGFKPAGSLPLAFERKLRPSIEIAKRLNAIKALVLWTMVAEEDLSNEEIFDFLDENELYDFITEDEMLIIYSPRNSEDFRDMIGWKFENAWPLAWYFGYKQPEISGEMMSGAQMRDILENFTCLLDENVAEWIKRMEIVTEEDVIKQEDLFYCLHNAVRSAQLGHHTVPSGFDPIGNGGVIHERRHSLTWMLSKGIKWDETDLST